MFEFLKRLDRIERYLNLPIIEDIAIEKENLEIMWRSLKNFEIEPTENELLKKIEQLEKELAEKKE